MKAAVITEFGGPQVLQVREVGEPVLASGEVLVQITAAGVNRADLLQRQGLYPPPPGAPNWPGLEVSGTISSAAGNIGPWAVGDEVCALLPGGGYAERVAVPWPLLLPKPMGVDLVDAAALPEAACTVWSNLVQAAGLGGGETILIHGGSSGIGTMAIQVARSLGARVAVTAQSSAKLKACRDLGAQILINYTLQDFVAELRSATQGQGAHVILDLIGAKYLERNIAALAPGGRLVVIGLQGGSRAQLDLGELLSRRASILASTLRARPLAERAVIVEGVRETIWPLIDQGAVRPVIDQRLPLARAGEAHEILAASHHIGKILLTMT